MRGGIWTRRSVLAALAALAVGLSSCSASPSGRAPDRPPSGSGGERPGATGGLSPQLAQHLQGQVPDRGLLPLRRGVPEGPEAALAVRARGDLVVWREPGGGTGWLRFPWRNPYGQVQTMLATGTRTRHGRVSWYRVQLPVGSHVSTGWVRARDVVPVEVRDRLVVDRSSFTLTWYRDGVLVERLRVGIGRQGFATPLGTFYVWAHVPQPSPNGPYGLHVLALSALSTVIEGRVAIHGTADPSDRGRRVSHGCIRVYNPELLPLRDVSLGAPVVIRD